ncbi:MAG: kelch repeat-containing protein [Bacteroidia bacterium]
MKNQLLHIIIFLFLCSGAFAQAGEWTWMRGDSTNNPIGYFGVKGVPSPLNTPPSLYEASQWTDMQGNFWLYGRISIISGNNTSYSDLWKFDPLTNEWTWIFGTGQINQSVIYGVKGVSSPINSPGARALGSGTWVDLQGNLWLYGGISYDTSYGNGGIAADLWKYDVSINEWTWINGFNVFVFATGNYLAPSGTHPGSRVEFNTTWTDSLGNLWLFGGDGADGCYNDLWKYEIAADTWTLMKGDTLPGSFGISGTMGVPSTLNFPAARLCYCKWQDNIGNFYLMGGAYRNSSGTVGQYKNDVWRYNVPTNTWTWISGNSGGWPAANFPTKCTSSTTTYPKGRFENRACWVDSCNNFWLFGGETGVSSYLTYNDLWEFNPSTLKWIWVSGNSTANIGCIYGVKGVPNSTNRISSRMGSVSWKDFNGNLWLFGGWEWGGSGAMKNDLWRYTPDSSCVGCLILPNANLQSTDTLFCEKHCLNFFDLSTNNPTSWQWLFPGADSLTSTLQNPTNICYNIYGSYDVTLIACNAAGCDTLHLTDFITCYQNPTDSIYQSNDTLFSLPAFGYQWYEVTNGIIAGATNQYFIPQQAGSYYCVISDSIGCNASSGTIVITATNQISNFNFPISIIPNPFENKITIIFQKQNISKASFTIKNVLGKTVFTKTVAHVNSDSKTTIDLSDLSNGIYFLEIVVDGVGAVRKIVKE